MLIRVTHPWRSWFLFLIGGVFFLLSPVVLAFKVIRPAGDRRPTGPVTGIDLRDVVDPTDPGPFLRWPSSTISYVLNDQGAPSRKPTFAEVRAAIGRSFREWSDDGGANFQFTRLDDPDRMRARLAFDGQNTLLWNLPKFKLPPELITHKNLGDTLVTYFNPTGEILDADIVFNTRYEENLPLVNPEECPGPHPPRHPGGVPIVWNIGNQGYVGTSQTSVYLADIESTATHEIGHLLGLGHSDVPFATMSIAATTPSFTCSLDQASIEADDIEGVMFLYNQQPPPASHGLSAWWKYDGNYKDSSENGVNGTAQGSGNSFDTVNVKQGKSSLATNGSGYVTYGNNLNLAATAPLTISLWMRRGTTVGAATLVAKQVDWTPHTNKGWILINNGPDGIYWQMNAGTSFGENELQMNWFNLPINDGNWHHIALTKSSSPAASAVTLYVDGVAIPPSNIPDSDTLTQDPINTTALSVAAQATGLHPLIGNIDSVKIEKRQWSAVEVQNEFRKGQ